MMLSVSIFDGILARSSAMSTIAATLRLTRRGATLTESWPTVCWGDMTALLELFIEIKPIRGATRARGDDNSFNDDGSKQR